MRIYLVLILALSCTAARNRQLSRSMVQQASTITNIEYEIILNNIAMFTTNPSLLPDAIRLTDGTVQVNDEGGIQELGVQWGGHARLYARPARRTQRDRAMGHASITDPLVV